jgi:small ligand-binding sensory domain FIST
MTEDYAAGLSRAANLDDALRELCDDCGTALGGAPDLAFCFVSPAHHERFADVAKIVAERLSPRCLLGCSGETVVGMDQEVEAGPAVSLWTARTPSATLQTFHAEFEQTPDGILCSGLPDDFGLGLTADSPVTVFCLGDPFSTAPLSLLDRLHDSLPGVPVIGGMASGGHQPGECAVWLGDRAVAGGAVGVVVQGGPAVRALVSQGCRPIGSPFVVTRAEQNVVWELGGRSPLAQLQDLFPTLSERDRRLVGRGLHLGLAMNEYQETFGRGDFLISNVTGADEESGAIAVGNLVRTGQTCQFHVRDAATATEDLTGCLNDDAERHAAQPRAALLFSCNGRGTRLFSRPHHDARAVQEHYGPLPLAGFFAQGELGPVGGRNYVHGYTASVALFE